MGRLGRSHGRRDGTQLDRRDLSRAGRVRFADDGAQGEDRRAEGDGPAALTSETRDTGQATRDLTSAVAYRTIDVKPCSPVIGAEIRGVDLTRRVSDEQWSEVHAAFLQHLVI